MRPLRIGLTGGIGAGKSQALTEFARLGARTIALDEVAREQARKGGPAYRKIVAAFGTAQRSKIAEAVFRSPAARRRLERITHPLILREMDRRLRAARTGVVVVDVPLLFEGGHEGRFDVTVAVSSPRRARLARVRRRDAVGAAEVVRRMAAQLPDGIREAKADVVIPNDGSRRDFRRRLARYYGAFVLMQSSTGE